MDEKVVVDASVWVSSLRQQDVNHNASRLWLEKYTTLGGLLIAPTLLLIEVAAAISRRTGDSTLAHEAVSVLRAARSIQFLPMDAALVKAATNVAAALQLRAGDAIYVAVAHELNIPLISWDKEQIQKASTNIVTYAPDEYVFQEEAEASEEEES